MMLIMMMINIMMATTYDLDNRDDTCDNDTDGDDYLTRKKNGKRSQDCLDLQVHSFTDSEMGSWNVLIFTGLLQDYCTKD